MSTIVTGLSDSGDVAALSAALVAASLRADALMIVSAGDSGVPLPSGPVTASGIITNDGGGSVPGLTHSGGMHVYGEDDGAEESLVDLGLSDDRVDVLREHLERGNTVVAYRADDGDAARVEASFAAAGLREIKSA